MSKIHQINTTVRDEFMRLTGLLVKKEKAESERDIQKLIALNARINACKRKIINVSKNASLCIGSGV